MHLQNRKKPCLMIVEGNHATKIASFNDEASAEEFADTYNAIIDAICEMVEERIKNGNTDT